MFIKNQCCVCVLYLLATNRFVFWYLVMSMCFEAPVFSNVDWPSWIFPFSMLTIFWVHLRKYISHGSPITYGLNMLYNDIKTSSTCLWFGTALFFLHSLVHLFVHSFLHCPLRVVMVTPWRDGRFLGRRATLGHCPQYPTTATYCMREVSQRYWCWL